ncbi:MAG: hypothetical protein WKF77_01115 [Planctomycetaceae bacterium]
MMTAFQRITKSTTEHLGAAQFNRPPRTAKRHGFSPPFTIVSLVIGILLLDDEFIVPDVLNRDKAKPITAERVERAHKNGKVGWDIGRELDVNPHWRRPHSALMWTGKGRTVARIVIRKGSIVRRSAVTDIPTSFMDKGVVNEQAKGG